MREQFELQEHISPKRDLSEGAIDYYPPVLLQQGFLPGLVFAAGATGSQQLQIATDRGDLKYIDIQPFFNGATNLAQPNLITISAGGIEILKNSMLADWSFKRQYGMDKGRRLRVALNDSQTLDVSGNATNSTTLFAAQTQGFYTTKAHEFFVHKVFSLRWGLGLKRRDYTLQIPTGLAAGTTVNTTPSPTLRLPREQGDIIAISIMSVGTEEDMRNNFHTLSIDGIRIIQDVWTVGNSFESGRDNALMPVFLRAGATFEFSALVDSSVALQETSIILTFYFDN